MPYYHVYIPYTKEGKRRRAMHYNAPKETIEQKIAIPYMRNKTFIFAGRVLHPSQIRQIVIFQSDKPAEELVLPNGKTIREEEDVVYIAKSFSKKIEGVVTCTYEFITSPPVDEELIEIPIKPLGKKEKVFIVHGKHEEQALRLQKYLKATLKIDAEMFEDFKQKSSSNTIIEQLEYIKDNVGYAFVIVTPDDLGCLREDIDKCRTTMLMGKRSVTVKSVCEILDNLHTRTRQNVVFELGLFIGALGRDRVCCLLQEDTKEKPSDIDGILYVGFKKSVKETFTEITEKLKNANLIKT